PSAPEHSGLRVNQCDVGGQETQLGDVCLQPRSLQKLCEQRYVGRRDRVSAPVMAAQKGDVVRVGGKYTGVRLGISSVPARDLTVEQFADSRFLYGSAHRKLVW